MNNHRSEKRMITGLVNKLPLILSVVVYFKNQAIKVLFADLIE